MQLKSQVDYFGRALLEKGTANPDIVVLDADVSASTKTSYFQESYPERFIEVGISEQDMIGIAAGLSLSGKIPVAAAFATFIVGRAWEQVANTVARQSLNVKIVGTHSGLTPSADGESHQSIADIAVTRVLPNMVVEVPADAAAAGWATRELLDRKGPVYLRLGRGSFPMIYPDDIELEVGRAETLLDGDDVTIVSTGSMVHVALSAAETLMEEGLSSRVLDMHTIKPLDCDALEKAASETGCIVTVEEHSVIGGLGGAVTEAVSERKPVPISRVGIKDRFGQSSRNYQALLERYGLTPEAVAGAARKVVESK
ncbi:MAG: transketolase family protein [Candidatus Bathyarchaeota archaeon]|nr:transketolase family protein [Candidatus Bathyarchaeota archaeon]